MQPTSTLKTLLWVFIFIGSTSVVTLIRRQLSASQQLTNVARTVSAQVLRTASTTRGLLLPQ